jgi:hypothetical protein
MYDILHWAKKLRGLSPRANYTDFRLLSAKSVPTFAYRGCHLVSVTDPYCRILGFVDLEPLLFLSSSSSIVLRG